jgi:hypothetical protein
MRAPGFFDDCTLDARIREAFDEAWRAILRQHANGPLINGFLRERERSQWLPGFAGHYRRLTALPRRTRRSLQRTSKRALSVIALLMTLGPVPAWAANIHVSPNTPPSIKSDGKCSLIEAIVNANKNTRTHLDCVAGSGTDTILLPANSQQALKGQEMLSITSRIVIEGNGSTILRSANTNVTFVSVSASGNLTLNETTVTGATANFTSRGYGVSNAGRIALNDSSIADTGGVRNSGGTAILTRSSVTGTRPHYDLNAGGIQNLDGATLVATNSVIANNGTAMVRRSTISGNRLLSFYQDQSGGGIANGGQLTLVNSTVSNNEAMQYGGGVFSAVGALTILSSTVTGNSLSAGGGYTQHGGGVFVYSGAVTIKRSIVSGNSATVAREMGAGSGVAVTANDFNLFGRGGNAGVEGFTPGPTDIIPSQPIGGILLPLADNGGDTDTLTHALAIGSPALDASPPDADCPAIDQRGGPRPRGPACDIGSFEGSAVLCNGKVTTMVGTDGPEELTGTPGPDVIAGLNGDDAIGGLGGNDVICAGDGADNVFGGDGNDKIFGQGGNDQLFGGDGTDSLDGGTGQDQCFGGPGTGDTATACETVTGVP